jgi:uncharacterized membrane protein YbhN (UPF0104 family)
MSEPGDAAPLGDDAAISEPSVIRVTLEATKQFYAAPPNQSRVRRATDVVGLVVSLLALAGVVAAQPPGSFQIALLRFLESLPTWLYPIWGFLIGLLALWGAAMLLVPLITRRPRITVEALLAVVLAAALGLVSARVGNGSWPGGSESAGLSNHLHFPTVRLGLAAAIVAVVNGQIARPLGTTGRWVLGLGAIAVVMDGRTTIGGAAAAILIGMAAGSIVRLALGTSAGRPTLGAISRALGRLGVEATDLRAADRQVAGVFLIHARRPDGGPLAIKVFGRDAYDNQLLARVWRTLAYRDNGAARGFSRGDPAEREAFLTLLARNAGVPTSAVVTAGVTPRQDSLVVLEDSGSPLSSLTADEIGDDALAAFWSAVDTLGRAHIAHQQISPATLRLAGSGVTLGDLGGGIVTSRDDERLTDQAQLLTATATVVGSERAVRAAGIAIGNERVAALLPYLQEAAFSGTLRRSLKAAEIDLDDLRKAAAESAGVAQPELVRLRRVTWGTLIQLGLLVFAGAAVLSFVGGVDLGELRDDLSDASWTWVIVAGLVAQLPRVTQAISTMGAIPVRLPFGPVYGLQLATSYMNLALPSSIGRMAVSIRFFQRHGVAPAIAVTSGVIDSLTNSVVQVLLLISLLIFSSATLNLDFNGPSTSDLTHLLIVLVGILVVVVIAVLVLPWGRRLIASVRERIGLWWPQVKSTFTVLRGSHKLAQLLLGNVATEVLFATALGLFARALGYPISLADLLVINTSVSLFATFIPVPGGIGVVEGGLLVGLTSVGMQESSAFATVMLYRITTFYLPPIWGWFALNWLRKKRYL